MSEHFEGQAELVDQRIQDNKQGKSLTVFLKMPINRSVEGREIQKELVDLLGNSVKATLSIETDKQFSTVIDGEFWFKVKKLKKQNLLILEITTGYDKPLRKKLVDLEFHNLDITIDAVQKELELENGSEQEEEE